MEKGMDSVDLVRSLMQHDIVSVAKKGNEQQDGVIEKAGWIGRKVTLHVHDKNNNEKSCQLKSSKVIDFFKQHNTVLPNLASYNLNDNEELQNALDTYSNAIEGTNFKKALSDINLPVKVENEGSVRNKVAGDISLTKNDAVLLQGDTMDIDMSSIENFDEFSKLMDEALNSLTLENKTPKKVLIRNGDDYNFKFWQKQKSFTNI